MGIGHLMQLLDSFLKEKDLQLWDNLASKKLVPASVGTFRTEGPTFVILLIGTVLLVGALTFLPALAIGPVVEHYLMNAGTLF